MTSPFNILVIDDDPVRAVPLLEMGHRVFLAHGFDQVKFYLQNARKIGIDFICLDHDMPAMNGTEILNNFDLEMVQFPIWIWSWNVPKATEMKNHLQELKDSMGLLAPVWDRTHEAGKDFMEWAITKTMGIR